MRLRVSAVALAVLAAACAEVPTGLIEPSLQGGSPLLAIHNSPTAGALDDASNAYDEVATNKYAKRNPGTFDGDRQYMRTVATDYNGKDFTAQLVFSLTNTAGDGATIHFFGMGPGTPAGANNEPTGVFFRIHTPDVGGGAIHVASRNAAGGGFTSVTSIGNITVNGGTHRAIITKSGNQMTFGVDVGNDGTVNFSHVVSNYTTLTDINGSNSSIYFGTSNQDRFTPSITVAGAGELVIDDFTSGGGTFVGGWWGYRLQTSLSDVVGGSREHGWYNHNGVRVDEVAGTLEWGIQNSVSPQYGISWGNSIGTQVAGVAPSPNTGPELNLNLSPEDEFLVDVVRVTAHHIDIVLRSGNGEPFKYTLNMSSGPGEFRVPLSQFKSLWNNQPLGAARAADIDGIHVFGHGHIGTKFGKFAIATGAPADNTPPVITADVSGTLGSNGWYTSDVSVSWSVTDPDSPVSSSSGCGAASVTSDTNGTTFTCTATSAGGTSTRSVTVKRDATNPDVALVGNAGSYTVDQVVSITCSISDAMSGLASQACNGASGPAYTFSVGSNPVSATAADNAGNSASASGSFTVSVTAGSLCNLVNQWVTQRGVANALCEQLANGAYRAFRNHVKAQAGKHVPADKAPILLGLADHL